MSNYSFKGIFYTNIFHPGGSYSSPQIVLDVNTISRDTCPKTSGAKGPALMTLNADLIL